MLKKYYYLQAILSYLGILPYIFILFDLHIFSLFSISDLKDFIIFYTLIIFSFIGAMRWNFDEESKIIIILYGFTPSLISTTLIFFNLLNVNKNLIILLITLSIIAQLIGDFIFYKINHSERYFFQRVRLPITIIISIISLYLILV